MAKVQIKLAPRFVTGGYQGDELVNFTRQYLHKYITLQPFSVVGKDGIEAAEEVFSIVNNPSRETDRARIPKHKRRLFEAGDVVQVGKVDYLCTLDRWVALRPWDDEPQVEFGDPEDLPVLELIESHEPLPEPRLNPIDVLTKIHFDIPTFSQYAKTK